VGPDIAPLPDFGWTVDCTGTDTRRCQDCTKFTAMKYDRKAMAHGFHLRLVQLCGIRVFLTESSQANLKEPYRTTHNLPECEHERWRQLHTACLREGCHAQTPLDMLASVMFVRWCCCTFTEEPQLVAYVLQTAGPNWRLATGSSSQVTPTEGSRQPPAESAETALLAVPYNALK
jgi:hypothetical protein